MSHDLVLKYFPYSNVRIGQLEMATITYETIARGNHAVIEGANGIGKTAALLSAALTSLESYDCVIFYYSRTHRQNENVIRELLRAINYREHPNLFAVELRGRSALCRDRVISVASEDLLGLCRIARNMAICGPYLKASSRRSEIERRTMPLKIVSCNAITEIADEFECCPYEAMRSVLPHANLVVLTYPYFVNRFLRERTFSAFPRTKGKVAIFDECVDQDTEIMTPNRKMGIEETIDLRCGLLTSLSLANEHVIGTVPATYYSKGRVAVRKVITVHFSNGQQVCLSDKTPLLCADIKYNRSFWKNAGNLKVGDRVTSCEDGVHIKTILIDEVFSRRKDNLFELCIPRFHNFIANGIIVHNSHNLFNSLVDENTSRITMKDIRTALIEAAVHSDDTAKFIIKTLTKFFEELKGRKEKEIPSKEILSHLSDELGGLDLIDVFRELEERGRSILRYDWGRHTIGAAKICKVASFMLEWISCADDKDYVPVLIDSGGHGIELLFVSPTIEGKDALRQMSSSVHVSGTLEPVEAYRDTVGLPSDAYVGILPSPYQKENILCSILRGYTSKFEDRDERNYATMIRNLASLLEILPGKVGVFMPSYEVLDTVHEIGLSTVGRTFYWERGDMSSNENLELLRSFKSAEGWQKSTLVAVAGGRSSEGVDYPGGAMDSSIVSGIPFPKPTARLRKIIGRLDLSFPGKGWLYGYVVPSIARAAQASGRAIRSPDRKASIILMDDRYENEYIFGCLPKWLKMIMSRRKSFSLDELSLELERFWRNERLSI